MSNGKLREARTLAERLAAILVMVVNRNESNNVAALSAGRKESHILSAGDFLQIVQPFLDLAEVQAEKTQVVAGKIIGVALREKSLHDLTARETAALFAIAEMIRKLELPSLAEGAS